jgi:hypothetical protein
MARTALLVCAALGRIDPLGLDANVKPRLALGEGGVGVAHLTHLSVTVPSRRLMATRRPSYRRLCEMERRCGA